MIPHCPNSFDPNDKTSFRELSINVNLIPHETYSMSAPLKCSILIHQGAKISTSLKQ